MPGAFIVLEICFTEDFSPFFCFFMAISHTILTQDMI